MDNIFNSWGKKKVSQDNSKDNVSCCWKKKSIFFDLEYWRYLHVLHKLDVMYVEKNVCKSIIVTLLKI